MSPSYCSIPERLSNLLIHVSSFNRKILLDWQYSYKHMNDEERHESSTCKTNILLRKRVENLLCAMNISIVMRWTRNVLFNLFVESLILLPGMWYLQENVTMDTSPSTVLSSRIDNVIKGTFKYDLSQYCTIYPTKHQLITRKASCEGSDWFQQVPTQESTAVHRIIKETTNWYPAIDITEFRRAFWSRSAIAKITEAFCRNIKSWITGIGHEACKAWTTCYWHLIIHCSCGTRLSALPASHSRDSTAVWLGVGLEDRGW